MMDNKTSQNFNKMFFFAVDGQVYTDKAKK